MTAGRADIWTADAATLVPLSLADSTIPPDSGPILYDFCNIDLSFRRGLSPFFPLFQFNIRISFTNEFGRLFERFFQVLSKWIAILSKFLWSHSLPIKFY